MEDRLNEPGQPSPHEPNSPSGSSGAARLPIHEGFGGRVDTRVIRILADVLGVDEADMTPESCLRGDLGVESIDLLDIVFRLEREFGVSIDGDDLFPEGLADDFARFGVGDVGSAARVAVGSSSALLRPARRADVQAFTVAYLIGFVRYRLGR